MVAEVAQEQEEARSAERRAESGVVEAQLARDQQAKWPEPLRPPWMLNASDVEWLAAKEAWTAQLSAHYRAGREADWAFDDARYALRAAQAEVHALQREWERAKARQHVCQQDLDGFMDHCWSRLPTERVDAIRKEWEGAA
jgi:hypothetical protein